jgi:choline-sulfatase
MPSTPCRPGLAAAAWLLLTLALPGHAARGDATRGNAARGDSSGAPTPATGPNATRPNVVVVIVDTLRADRVRALGDRLPYLSALRARAVVFERALSPSSWTPTATASIFTGLWPHQHGVRTGYLALKAKRRLGPVDRLPDAAATLPEVMRAAGYHTVGVSDNVNIGETTGFARGFHTFVSHRDQGAARVAKSARRALSAHPIDRPYFLYLHLMDPHAPYRKRPGYRAPPRPEERALARYDSEIVHVDRHLRTLHDALGWERDTLLVFSSDHGEAFGEHGCHGHPNQLYQELLAVPLLFFFPGRLPAGTLQEPVSTLDILPTLRGLLGLPPDPDAAGMDLSAQLRAASEPAPRALFSLRYSDLVQPPLERRAVVAEGMKLIEYFPGGRLELFDLGRDSGEIHDLSVFRATETARLRALLEDAARLKPQYPTTRLPAPKTPQDQAGLIERLRALGYVQ